MPRGEPGAGRKVWEQFIEKYAGDPVLFAREVLKFAPTDWQRETLSAIQSGETRLSIRSGHGVGKSSLVAVVLTWKMCTVYPLKAIVTAPTHAQAFDAVFAETKSMFNRLPAAVQRLFNVKSDRIELKSAPAEQFISCRVAARERPEALAGVHAKNVVICVDEASGVPDELFIAGQGSMSTHGAITLLTGNPTRNTGFFADTHNRFSDEWWTRKVSCLDQPTVDPEFVRSMRVQYGDDSTEFRVRCLGEFPLQDADTLISREAVEAATRREVEPFGAVVWGLDVARKGGDRSVLVKRHGNVVREIRVWKDLDLMALAGAVVNEFESEPQMYLPAEIMVDAIGMGAGVCDRLVELGLPAISVNVAESAALKGKYGRLRDELWASCRDWFHDRKCKIPPDEKLVNELSSVQYTYTSSGKLQVESKDQMKRRANGASPDLADALCLTFASTAATAAYGSARIGGGWSKPLELDLSWVH